MTTPPVKKPPKPLVPNCVRCVVHGTFGGNVISVFHINTLSMAMTAPNILAVATAVFNAYKNQLITPLASSFAISSCDALDISSSTGIMQTFSGSGAGGDITSGNDPSSVACCVSWQQPLHFRGGHPRTYLPGIRPGMRADTKTFTSSFRTAMNNAATAFLNTVNSNPTPSIRLTMVRYPYDKASNTWGTPAMYDIVGSNVNLRIDSQRRRLGK